MEYINRCLGLDLASDAVQKLLGKMQIETAAPSSSAAKDALSLLIPPTRSDVLHACDIMEDVAIAYGYNNLPKHVSLSAREMGIEEGGGVWAAVLRIPRRLTLGPKRHVFSTIPPLLSPLLARSQQL